MTLPFAFPVLGLLDAGAPHEPGETGTRHYAEPEGFDIVWVPWIARLEGMRLIDNEGRSWTVSGVRKAKRLRPFSRRWRIDYSLTEGPTLAFEEVRGLLLNTLRARRSAYAEIGHHHMKTDRQEILAARSLRDIVRSKVQIETANAPKPASGFDLWLGEGRGSRLEFTLGLFAAAVVLILSLAGLQGYWRVSPVIVGALALGALCATIALLRRRLHDLGLSGMWGGLGFGVGCLTSILLEALLGDASDRWIGLIWFGLAVLFLGFPAIWPGQPRANRFGQLSARRARRLDAAAGTADHPQPD